MTQNPTQMEATEPIARVNELNLTLDKHEPMEQLMTMLEAAGIDDDQIVSAHISIEFVDQSGLPTLGEADQLDGIDTKSQHTRYTIDDFEADMADVADDTDAKQSETEQPEPQAEVALNVAPYADVPTVEYGSQRYAILKHAEKLTDEGEWAIPGEIADQLDIPHASVSSSFGKYADKEIVERAEREGMQQPAYKYQITLLGREMLRRSEFAEEQRQNEGE
ncbi:hypothetical protein HUG10_21300 (plasmid) [Halorarum halophilum]|uniref:Uncharacterized protein n=1 Tax=Halorarum halophilum TaxID=2743090 RepID=A0A7D5GEY0_9EURY|nr:hypothetical protein [Halobaculum halophilum]QLG30126.1 hypothetical protein HUG10_21300 [Halobaculum halophilum]